MKLYRELNGVKDFIRTTFLTQPAPVLQTILDFAATKDGDGGSDKRNGNTETEIPTRSF